MVFQHIERICAEPLDNASGRAFPDAFEQTRRKIAQKSFRCRRHKLVPVLHMELQAVLALFPVSLDLQLDGIRLRQSIADSGEPKHPVSERVYWERASSGTDGSSVRIRRMVYLLASLK